jgi:hypothetical protein
MLRALLVAAVICLSQNASFAGQSGWKFEIDDRDQPGLKYMDNDKSIFYIGCGRAFGVHAVYPGPYKKDGTKAIVRLSNSRQQITLKGEIDKAYDDDPSGTTHFVQWDLGFKRQDPALYGVGWKKIEDRFLNLLDSGKPLTVSAEGRRYVLPPVDSRQWKSRFKEKC